MIGAESQIPHRRCSDYPIACPSMVSPGQANSGPGARPGLPFGEGDPLPVDLSDKAIAAALNRLLDEIAETARATSPTGRVSRRLIGPTVRACFSTARS
jgi:hypothetical protein